MNATAVKKVAVKQPAVKTVKNVAAKKVAAKKIPATKAPVKVAAKKAAVAKPMDAGKATALAAPKVEKVKIKLVRDSFTMPTDDWALIAQLKERALAFKRPAKKSELLRAGLQVLASLPDAQLKAALEGLLPLKPGRPKSDVKAEKK